MVRWGSNLVQTLTPLREFGVGQVVRRKIWSKYSEPSYWKVTQIKPSEDLKHGKVYGVFTRRGKNKH